MTITVKDYYISSSSLCGQKLESNRWSINCRWVLFFLFNHTLSTEASVLCSISNCDHNERNKKPCREHAGANIDIRLLDWRRLSMSFVGKSSEL